MTARYDFIRLKKARWRTGSRGMSCSRNGEVLADLWRCAEAMNSNYKFIPIKLLKKVFDSTKTIFNFVLNIKIKIVSRYDHNKAPPSSKSEHRKSRDIFFERTIFYWPPSRHLSTQSRCRFLKPKPFVPFKMHYAVNRETFVTVEVLWREELKHYNRITQTICHNKDLTQSVRSLPGDRGTVFSSMSGWWIMIECSLCWLIPENHPGVVLSKSMRQQ